MASISLDAVPSDITHGNRGGGALHALATALASGFMSVADKGRLDQTPTPFTTLSKGGVVGVQTTRGVAV